MTGADVGGWAALTAHVHADDVIELKAALAAGADPNAANPTTRETVLMTAIFAGNREAVEVLLDAGADPDQRDRVENTALHVAGKVDEAAALLLLERGATPDVRNKLGATFQEYAAMTSSELLSEEAAAARERLVSWLDAHEQDVPDALRAS